MQLTRGSLLLGVPGSLLEPASLVPVRKALMGKVMLLKMNKEISKENEEFFKFINVLSGF